MKDPAVYEFDIEAADEGERLDSYLNQQFTDLSRSYLQKIIKGGGCLVNGVVVTKAGF